MRLLPQMAGSKYSFPINPRKEKEIIKARSPCECFVRSVHNLESSMICRSPIPGVRCSVRTSLSSVGTMTSARRDGWMRGVYDHSAFRLGLCFRLFNFATNTQLSQKRKGTPSGTRSKEPL